MRNTIYLKISWYSHSSLIEINVLDGLEAVDGKTPVFCQGVAPPPPPLPPPDLLTPAPARRNLERKSSSDSMNSLNTLLSAEFSKHDNVQSEDGEVHVLRQSCNENL